MSIEVDTEVLCYNRYMSFLDFCAAMQEVIAPGGNVSGNVQVYAGRKTGNHVSPPAIFLYPVNGNFSGPMGAGHSTNPPILHSRDLQVEAHCWSVGYDDAEGLETAVITAIRDVMGGANYQLLGERWEDESLNTAGVAVVLTFSMRMGVPAARLTLAPMVGAGALTVETYATAIALSGDTIPYSPTDML